MTGKNRGVEPIYSLDHFLKLNQGIAELRVAHQHPINPEFFCRRCAYMQLEPDYDYWGGFGGQQREDKREDQAAHVQ